MAGKITLSESNNEIRIEWKINHFFIRENNLIVSPDFLLFQSKWLLQLHLGGKLTFFDTGNDYYEPLRMSLLTLNPTTRYRFEYRMGIQACNGSEITTEKFQSVFKKIFGQNPQRLELISRKDFESSRNTLVTHNTLTVFCAVRLMNVIKPAGDIASLTPSTDSDFSSSRSSLLFCDERNMAGEITLDEWMNETRIEWRINDFSNRKNYSIESPDFVLFNSKWLLKIKHADKFIKSFSEPGVSDSFLSMSLEIASHLKANIHIEFVMGIQMVNGSEIRTEKFKIIKKPVENYICRDLDIISSKDFKSASDILDSKNNLKVFCTVRLLRDDNNSPGDITLLQFNSSNSHRVWGTRKEGEITLYESKHETRIEWMLKHVFLTQSWLTESPDFVLFKSNWFLQIDTSKNYVCMRLQRDYCSTADNYIEYRMGIQRLIGSEIITEKFESVLQPRFIQLLPKHELISEKDLESLCVRYTLAHGGFVKVFCIVRLLSDDNPVENVQPPITSTQGVASSSGSSRDVCISKGIHTFIENFKNLYQSKRFTDVTIKVKDKEFLAHKTILSTRSEVFASMFEHDTSEKRSSVVDITDCDSRSFEDFLLYLYTGKLDTVSSSNAVSLFKTADKYGVEELKIECVRCMVREITVGSFCDIFHLADLHGESDLLATATSFFIHNANAILVTKEWVTLLEEHPSLCNELFVKFAKSGLQK